MALPPSFLDELRARTPLAAVVGRRVKLTRSGRNWKGCCPFHNEKTPSFYVYDDGYHCFGCGAHGDAIGFVMQAEGAGFMEAVERLAAEAGLEVPKPTPAAAEAERRRLDLAQVLEAAAASFQRRLRLPEGRAGLAYLHGRGLDDATIDAFGLGWSGEGRGGLAAELAREAITPEQLLAAGLLRAGEDGWPARELFYNRVMFPIRDRRGRIVSFGGRILGDGQPKYVNGPETALFSKRHTLYALDRARAAARSGEPVVVVEGYMDVIALHAAGLTGAVAPLGTALTAEQLEELWRLSPNPVLCFDGDAAGARAAARAALLALPLLTPARGLRHTALPAGEDPDTLLRHHGASAVRGLLEAARPLSDALYDLLAEGTGPSPEARASLRARLIAASATIPDRGLAGEYRRVLLDRFWQDRPPRPGFRPGARPGARPIARPAAFARPAPDPAAAAHERARILIAIVLRHPYLLAEIEEALVMLDLPPALERLRAAILPWAERAEPLDSAALVSHLHSFGLGAELAEALSEARSRLPDCARASAMPAEAGAGWWHFFGLMDPGRLDADIAAAAAQFTDRGDSRAEARLRALSRVRARLRRGEADDGQPDEAGAE